MTIASTMTTPPATTSDEPGEAPPFDRFLADAPTTPIGIADGGVIGAALERALAGRTTRVTICGAAGTGRTRDRGGSCGSGRSRHARAGHARSGRRRRCPVRVIADASASGGRPHRGVAGLRAGEPPCGDRAARTGRRRARRTHGTVAVADPPERGPAAPDHSGRQRRDGSCQPDRRRLRPRAHGLASGRGVDGGRRPRRRQPTRRDQRRARGARRTRRRDAGRRRASGRAGDRLGGPPHGVVRRR